MIINRAGVDMPVSLGRLLVGACDKKKRKNYDWYNSVKLGQDVYHKNWDCNQYLCKIFYTNYDTRFKFKFSNLWSFKACRLVSRKASKEFKKNWNFYTKISYNQRISKLCKQEEGINSIKLSKYEKTSRRMDLSNTQPD